MGLPGLLNRDEAEVEGERKRTSLKVCQFHISWIKPQARLVREAGQQHYDLRRFTSVRPVSTFF